MRMSVTDHRFYDEDDCHKYYKSHDDSRYDEADDA